MYLLINSPGYIFTLYGQKITTPCNVDIQKYDINTVIMTLRRNGISKYSIIEEPKTNTTILPESCKVIKSKKQKDIIIQKVDDTKSLIELNKLSKKFERLESFLSKLVDTNKPSEQSSIKPKRGRKIETKIEELDDEFVPQINLDGVFNNQRNDTIENIEIDGDINNAADILRELKGDKP